MSESINSASEVLIIRRLNATVNELDLHVAILGSIQSLGYDSPTESQKSVIDMFVCGNDVFVSLPTGSGKSLCYASLPGVFDRLRQVIKASDRHHSIAVVVSPLSALMQDQVWQNANNCDRICEILSKEHASLYIFSSLKKI